MPYGNYSDKPMPAPKEKKEDTPLERRMAEKKEQDIGLNKKDTKTFVKHLWD